MTKENDLPEGAARILDHGYLKLVESWGSDERIIEAARMSTNKGFQGWGPKEDGKPGDEKLLRYLWQNQHSTPFEMAGFTVEVQAPIFVFREWMRHRTQSFNEMSARYTPLPAVDYMPTWKRVISGSREETTNKQSSRVSGAPPISDFDADLFRQELGGLYDYAQRLYERWLERGVPKELARVGLTVGRYSRMRASANLRNWLGFLSLRLPENAQYEIRVYAEAVSNLVKELYPRTHALFEDVTDG